jgi:AraC-like DNA-binding protein
MRYADFGAVRVQVNAVDNEYLARAQFHPDRWAMFIDIGEQPGTSLINGNIMGRDGAMLFGPGGELHARVTRGQAWCMLTFAIEPIAGLLDRALGPLPGGSLFAPHLLGRAPGLARLSRDLSAVLFADPGRLDAGSAGAAVADSVVAQLGAALETLAPRSACRAQQRQVRLVAGAVDLLEASLDRPVYTASVAGHLGVGVRTLNEAFRAVYGTSLHQWLRLRRLALARRWLRDAEGPTLIKQIALDAGFWHFGRFASAYRRMYGETPSDTLAARTRPVGFVSAVCAPPSSATVRAGR